MRELSIEEKAKAYDEAIERGKQIQNTPYTAHWDIMKEVVEHLLPELKESEGERIINLLKMVVEKWQNVGYADYVMDIPKSDILNWLEKQGDANKEYWRGYREGKQEILDKYAEFEKQGADSLPKDNWELIHEFVNKFGRIPKDEDELNVLIEYVLKRQKPDDIIPQDFEKYVERLLSLSDGEGHGSPAKVKEVSAELLRLANLKQKPTEWSKEDDLEKASTIYADNEEYGDDVYYAIKAAFKEGAKWNKPA